MPGWEGAEGNHCKRMLETLSFELQVCDLGSRYDRLLPCVYGKKNNLTPNSRRVSKDHETVKSMTRGLDEGHPGGFKAHVVASTIC